MTHSIGELRALTVRAARGGGFEWGMADEAAHAVCWLASFGLPGPELFVERLVSQDGRAVHELMPSESSSGWFGSGDLLCPLLSGAALSDHAFMLTPGKSQRLENVLCPLLIAPFAARVAHQLGRRVLLEWSGVRLVTDGLGVMIEGDRGRLGITTAQTVRCMPDDDMSNGMSSVDFVRPSHTRLTVGEGRLAALSSFASRTCAPATEESRRLGAGGADPD